MRQTGTGGAERHGATPPGPLGRPPVADERSKDALSITRVCTSTGLVLERSLLRKLTRIAKKSRGPFNPLLRKDNPQKDPGQKRGDWGRYDVLGHRTVYGASPVAASYGESVAFARQKLMDEVLGTYFPESDPGSTRTFEEVVRQEWQEKSALRPGFLPAQWRLERLEYELTLPLDGWFVDIEAAQSVSAVATALRSQLAALGLEHLTVAHLRGEDRRITTAVAEWVHGLMLDDGSRAHGIKYGSKHGSDWSCWAIWLRRVDEGEEVAAEPTTTEEGTEIKNCLENRNLREAAELFRIRCF